MFRRLIIQLRNWRDRSYVRPWALAAPVVILLFCLPLLRPLRHPDPLEISHDETARLATIQAVGERRTLALDPAAARFSRQIIRDRIEPAVVYADQPPTLSVLLGGVYRLLIGLGFSLDSNTVFVSYLLTVVGSTLPVALAAGLVYRMGRVFELRRPVRAALGLFVICASGLISYATVLNAYAPASALCLASVGCLIQIGLSKTPARSGAWVAGSGFCAALATTIEPTAGVLLVLLGAGVLAVRWKLRVRIGALLLYLIGCSVPLVLHVVLTYPMTGDFRPGFLHPELAVYPRINLPTEGMGALQFFGVDLPSDDSDWSDESSWVRFGRSVERVAAVLFGGHGILSHFPIMIVGVFGIFAIMHRHWPSVLKVLAGATGIGTLVLICIFALLRTARLEPMFGAPAFAVFLPLLIFWAGAWLRRQHPWWTWSAVGLLVAFSTGVSLVGATLPFPRDGYQGYSARAALRELFRSDPSPIEPVVASIR